MKLVKGTMVLLMVTSLLAGCGNKENEEGYNPQSSAQMEAEQKKAEEKANKEPIRVLKVKEENKDKWGTLKAGTYTTKNGAYNLNMDSIKETLFKKADTSEWLTNAETALLVESTIYKQFKDGFTCRMHKNEGINFSSEEQAEKLTPLYTKDVLLNPVHFKDMNESQRKKQEEVFNIFDKEEVIKINPKLSKYKDECYFVYYFEDLDIYVVNFNTRDYIVYNRIGAPIGRAENTNFWLTEKDKKEVGKGIVKGKAEYSQFAKSKVINPSRTSESVGEEENYVLEDCGCE